jgi:hypothetical protein
MELVYCATPSRMKKKTDKITDFVQKRGLLPFHPYRAFPYERFKGNPEINEEIVTDCCRKIMPCCDRFFLFGISAKTLLVELEYALWLPIEIEFHFQEFDPIWKETLEKGKKGPGGHNIRLFKYLEMRLK